MTTNTRNFKVIGGVLKYTNKPIILRCSGRDIKYIKKFPNTLEAINCARNQLKFLPKLSENLYIFECSSNQITRYPYLNKNFNSIPISFGSKFFILYRDNQITDLLLPSKFYYNEQEHIGNPIQHIITDSTLDSFLIVNRLIKEISEGLTPIVKKIKYRCIHKKCAPDPWNINFFF